MCVGRIVDALNEHLEERAPPRSAVRRVDGAARKHDAVVDEVHERPVVLLQVGRERHCTSAEKRTGKKERGTDRATLAGDGVAAEVAARKGPSQPWSRKGLSTGCSARASPRARPQGGDEEGGRATHRMFQNAPPERYFCQA